MADKLFTQEGLNRIVASRLKRERDRLAREYESSLKRCMASLHLMLHQEMCCMKRGMAAETKDTLLSDSENITELRPDAPPSKVQSEECHGGGEPK